MSETVQVMNAPSILLTGNMRMDDGTMVAVVDYDLAQQTPQATPIFVNKVPSKTFVGKVTVSITSEYPLKDYSGVAYEADTYKVGVVQGDGTLGNIMYFIGDKEPSLTESNLYYSRPFTITKPNYGGTTTGRIHLADGVVAISAVVYRLGRISKQALAYVRIQ